MKLYEFERRTLTEAQKVRKLIRLCMEALEQNDMAAIKQKIKDITDALEMSKEIQMPDDTFQDLIQTRKKLQAKLAGSKNTIPNTSNRKPGEFNVKDMKF